MVSRRTTARLLLALLASWVVGATASTAGASVPDRIIFPVVGKATYIDDFGDPRGQGTHQGNDIMAARKAPAAAAEGGRVTLWTSSWRAGCMLYLYGRSGTTYLYIHLNNDLTMQNDNTGGCKRGVAYAPGLHTGDRVRAGQLVGYVGDSGDANGGQPHLHFELHPNGGAAVSPYPWLRKGRKLLFAVPKSVTEVSLRLIGTLRWVSPRLNVRVERVRVSTGWRGQVLKNVALTIPDDIVVERATGSGRTTVKLSDGVEGEGTVVWTKTVAPTLSAQLGRVGVLTAGHVLFTGPR